MSKRQKGKKGRKATNGWTDKWMEVGKKGRKEGQMD